MPQVLIRNIDRKTLTRLKEQAKRNHRSTEAEAKAILESGVALSPIEFLDVVRHWQERFRGRRISDSAKLIREDRDR